ncbi:family 78 glycoside hydrolase catalytic domain [Jiangella gansuensis]|uniref:family 78 glycoside hydrolase catalytic domain n=1 Tax=Jiangella gansuensis TaxID=281473 RepID=UPI0004B1E784|nr:family 78 glycoside hydrolase catalytic domain [Jiangella gansuensis]
MARPWALRVEHLDAPLGLTTPVPRFSWRLPPGCRDQHAYQLQVGEWDSGRVESDQSVLVTYRGRSLVSRERLDWRVRTWTDQGASEWSDHGWFEMGLLAPEDWSARWIGPVATNEDGSRGPGPAHGLQRAFTVPAYVARARIYATAHGVYELFLNDRRVGDMELTPGFTSYGSRLQVQTFDVTRLLEPGTNVLRAIVSDGWFRGQVGGCRMSRVYGDDVALLAQLEAQWVDGSSVCIGTDGTWTTTVSPIVAADLMQGTTVDLRLAARAGRAELRTPRSAPGVRRVAVHEYDLRRLCGSPAPPVRRVDELAPISVTRHENDQYVIDFGRNINGWINLRGAGDREAELTLTHGEALDQHGDVTLSNIAAEPTAPAYIPDSSKLTAEFQVDRVTVPAGAEALSFEPRHTVHGFRYVRLEGASYPVELEDVRAVVVHTDLRRTGWFACSDERLNRLHDAAVWSFRGNACDIPTDCPTRERQGWTGDWQIFAPTAAFLFDVAGFSAKWLHDLAAEQSADGLVFDCVPNTQPSELYEKLGIAHGSAGWGDAAVLVPWEIYRAYGDRDLLAEQWESMCAWVDHAARSAASRRHPARARQRPLPANHDRWILDTGFHYGEWLEPGEWDLRDIEDNMKALAAADHGELATAYLHRSSRLLAAIGRVLGHETAATRYERIADCTRRAWRYEFIRDDGLLESDSQAGYVRALAFGLSPAKHRQRHANRLVELIRAAGTHLQTGFLSTSHLLPVLARTGHIDVAYQLLLQDTEPSWLAMIDRGATTIWEAWDGIDEEGRPRLSLNHYSKGAVVSFLHQVTAGIQLLDEAPAYKYFRIAPMPGGGLSWVRAVHDSPYGLVEASWRLEEGRFHLEVVVPSGTTAEVRLPDGQRHQAGVGPNHYVCPAR